MINELFSGEVATLSLFKGFASIPTVNVTHRITTHVVLRCISQVISSDALPAVTDPSGVILSYICTVSAALCLFRSFPAVLSQVQKGPSCLVRQPGHASTSPFGSRLCFVASTVEQVKKEAMSGDRHNVVIFERSTGFRELLGHG